MESTFKKNKINIANTFRNQNPIKAICIYFHRAAVSVALWFAFSYIRRNKIEMFMCIWWRPVAHKILNGILFYILFLYYLFNQKSNSLNAQFNKLREHKCMRYIHTQTHTQTKCVWWWATLINTRPHAIINVCVCVCVLAKATLASLLAWVQGWLFSKYYKNALRERTRARRYVCIKTWPTHHHVSFPWDMWNFARVHVVGQQKYTPTKISLLLITLFANPQGGHRTREQRIIYRCAPRSHTGTHQKRLQFIYFRILSFNSVRCVCVYAGAKVHIRHTHVLDK